MPIETFMPFTFATFYTCTVKGLTNMPQRTCVNLLLKGILSKNANDGGDGVLSDADCSNYAKGKRKLSTDIQFELGKLTTEDIIKRLKEIKIRDFAIAAGALRTLITNSSLSEREKDVLIKKYQTDQELAFIAEVFLRSVSEDNSQPLTRTQVDTLNKYRDEYALAGDKKGTSVITEHQRPENSVGADLHEEIENKENFDWMGEYVSASMLEKTIMSADNGVAMHHEEIKLPEQYCRMVYILKPALTEANVRKISMNQFIEALDIDAASKRLREGRLECWQFEGTIDDIATSFEDFNFIDACGFVIQAVGAFEISQIERIEKILRDASNANVPICTPLIYKDVPDFKLILLVHRSKRRAEEQRLDTEHDNTRIYERGTRQRADT